MEITKYIGLYLLKNHFCYIHGLGNLELQKRPVIHDGKSLLGASWEVVVTQGGSIDDNLANFIATNEQVSIAKASNDLRDYSIQTRKDLAAGKTSTIDGIGTFIEENGRVKFITDEHFNFTPGGLPTIKNSRQLDEQMAKPAKVAKTQQPITVAPEPEPTKRKTVNWSRVILVGIVFIILAVSIFVISYYIGHSPHRVAPAPVIDSPQKNNALVDSAHKKIDSNAVTYPIDTNVNTYKMIIGDYPTMSKAESERRRLKAKGESVDLIVKDSVNYLLLATVNCKAIDTNVVKDTLVHKYNYKDIIIYKQ